MEARKFLEDLVDALARDWADSTAVVSALGAARDFLASPKVVLDEQEIKTWQERLEKHNSTNTIFKKKMGALWDAPDAMREEIKELRAALSAAAPQVTALGQVHRAKKIGGSYQADGTIVSTFATLAGEMRHVFEFDQPAGMLHIFGPGQVEIAAAPQVVADERAAWRAAGRAEALSILMGLCPETGIDEYTGWNTSGSPEDEGCAHWNEEKLRELLHVDSALADMMSKAEAAYYDYQAQKGEAEHATAFAANMHSSGRVREVLAKAGEHELIGDLCRAAAPVQAQEPVAWSYECKQPLTDPAVWCEFINRDRPSSASHVRNIKPLYAAPVQPVAVPDGWCDAVLSDDVCDIAAAQTLDRVAQAKGLHGLDVNSDVRTHDTLRRELIRAGHALAAPAAQGDAIEDELTKIVKSGAEKDFPGFLEWIADRLVYVHSENNNVDYVQTLRTRAKQLRAAIAAKAAS